MPKQTGMAALREQMEKKYGRARVTRRSDVNGYDVIPTGSFSLDLATRVGGWPKGRIIEIVGQPAVGKSSLVISSMAQAQKHDTTKAVAYIDMESTFDWDWAEKLGLDTSDEKFFHVYPDDSEDVSDQLKMLAESGQFSMIVVDSIGGMESKQAFDKEAGEHVMGRNAQVITRMVKRTAMLARREHLVILLVNQFRANLNAMAMKDQTAGPKAAKYATSMSVELSRSGEPPLTAKMPDGDKPEVVGYETKAKVVRNKVAAQGKIATYWFKYQETPEYGPVGIDSASEALAIGIFTKVVKQEGGGYYRMPWTQSDKDRIRGRDNVLAFLRENPDKAKQVSDLSVQQMSADVIPESTLDVEPIETEDGLVDPKTGEMVS